MSLKLSQTTPNGTHLHYEIKDGDKVIVDALVYRPYASKVSSHLMEFVRKENETKKGSLEIECGVCGAKS